MTDFTHSLAVLVGIDAYANGIPRLTTAVNDATRLAELLADAHGYETVLFTEPATGQPVTRARLAALFAEELPARLGEDDRLLVYFAGHGVALDGDDGPRGYLVPQDAKPGDSASMLAMTDLHAWLTALPCRHMLAILDCCFAGAFRWAATRHIGALPDVIYKERYDRYLRSPAWQVLTSAAYDQKALDVLNGKAIGVRESDGKGHSPFAIALIDALEKGEADLVPKGQGDGVITATELYLYLREQVEVKAEEQASHEQTPGLWPLNKHRKGEFIFLAPGHPLNLPPAPDLTDELNPYRGLKSYDQQHAPLFFGREDEIKELVALVEQQPFLAVLGASGTGKSSLVKAGMLPRLEVRSDDFSRSAPGTATEVATTNETYRVLSPMRPTDQPVRALETLLRAELADDLPGLGDLPGLDLAHIIARWAEGHPNERLVLTIDQFEELATLCRDDAERDRFLRLLAEAVRQHPVAFRLIITLRTDFEPQFTQEGSPLANLWQSARLAKPPARYVVPPMDIEDLRQVIEGPASVRVLYFDPQELVDDLIKEVIQTPGALPLLSFTLSELYVKYVQSGRDDRALAGADYRALGGVVGSLRNRATEEYDRLPDDAHRLTMQRVMLRMVATEGGDLARRRVALSELEYPTAEENARVQTVLDRLVNARLLVRDSDNLDSDGNPDPYVEPAHDALVLAWDKLLRWKKEAEDILPLQRRLAQAASEWSRTRPEARTGLLWDDDPRLPQVEETLWPTGGKQKGLGGRARWVKQVLAPKMDAPPDTKWLNSVELTFVQDSVRARTKFWRRAVSFTSLAVLALLVITIFALAQRSEATRQRNDANAQRDVAVTAEAKAISEGNARATEIIVRQTAEANAVFESNARATEIIVRQTAEANAVSESNARAAEIIVRQTAEANAISESNARATEIVMRATAEGNARRSAQAEATAAADARQKQAEAEREARRAKAGELAVQVQTVISNNENDPALALLLAIEAVEMTWRAPEHSVTINADKALRDVIDAAPPLIMTLPPQRLIDGANSATYNPDGRFIVSAHYEGMARIWNANTGDPIRTLNGHTGEVSSAAYSPDGRFIVTASVDQTARIWDATTGEALRTLRGHSAGVRSAVYGPDGKAIITTSEDKTIRIWDAATGQEVRQLSGHTGAANSAAYSPDGKSIVTASEDKTARIWEAATGQEVRQLTGHTGAVKSAAYSPDGKTIVTASDDRTIRIWDAATGQELRQLNGPVSGLNSATYSPDGKTIVTASSGWERGSSHYLNDQAARIWDADTGQIVFDLRHEQDVNSAAYSPDGKTIVTASYSTLRIWDTATGQEVRQLNGHTDRVNSAAYSPDGQFIVTASLDKTARIWNAATGQQVRELPHAYGVDLVAYSPDGKFLLTSECTGKMVEGCVRGVSHVWSVTTGQPIRTFDGYTAAYSPDGRFIVTADSNDVARIWDVATGQAVRQLSGHSGRVSSAAYSPDGRTIVTASDDKTARIWDVATGQNVHQLSGHTASVWSATFSPDGKQVVTASADRTARIWDTATGQEVRQLNGHRWYVLSAAYAPSGKFLVTAECMELFAGDCTNGISRIWDASTGEEVRTISGHGCDMHDCSRITSAVYSPDGKMIVTTGSDMTARVWGAEGRQGAHKLSEHARRLLTAAFSPEGRSIITAGCDDEEYTSCANARIWDATTGQQVHLLSGHGCDDLFGLGRFCVVSSVAYSSDGKMVVTTGTDKTARIWDATTGQAVRTLSGHTGWVSSAAYSPDGRFIVTASNDDTARIWEAATGQELRQLSGHADAVSSVAYSPDGRLIVTASEDDTVRVWEAATGLEVRQLTGPTNNVNLAIYSPDGQFIVTANGDYTVRIWEAATGQEVRQLRGHTSTVTSVAYSPNGKQIVTASSDETARIWDTATGQEVRQLSGILAATYSTDGMFIRTVGVDETVRMWIANFDDLLIEAKRLVWRDPPLLTPEERRQYGLE